uniref:Uncharacterized protein n=1 Tax=Sarcophilus harrisii TaxID=9305 RepID=A0A7N4PYV6_SARHA
MCTTFLLLSTLVMLWRRHFGNQCTPLPPLPSCFGKRLPKDLPSCLICLFWNNPCVQSLL